MGDSKCRFRYVSSCEIEKFNSATCMLGISVGQEYHEGEKFSSTVNLVSRSFSGYKVMLYDTLQRYTMAIDSLNTTEYFHGFALREGDRWLDRNKGCYENDSKFIEVIRWDYWLNHPDFASKKEEVLALMSQDMDYKKSFEITAKKFIDRYLNRFTDKSSLPNIERAYNLCMEYLIEECSALCLWPEAQVDYEVYPNRRNPAMDATHRCIVLKDNPGKLHSVGIKFKRKGQLSPQKFELITEKDKALALSS